MKKGTFLLGLLSLLIAACSSDGGFATSQRAHEAAVGGDASVATALGGFGGMSANTTHSAANNWQIVLVGRHVQLSFAATGGDLCLSAADSGIVEAVRCRHHWRQRFVVELRRDNWMIQFRLNGTDQCLQVRAHGEDLRVGPCDGPESEFNVRCDKDRFIHVGPPSGLMLNNGQRVSAISVDPATGRVYAGVTAAGSGGRTGATERVCERPSTKITLIDWL